MVGGGIGSGNSSVCSWKSHLLGKKDPTSAGDASGMSDSGRRANIRGKG